jgi:hypothetical protein
MNDAACALEITLLPVTQGFAPILLFGVDFERCDWSFVRTKYSNSNL